MNNHNFINTSANKLYFKSHRATHFPLWYFIIHILICTNTKWIMLHYDLACTCKVYFLFIPNVFTGLLTILLFYINIFLPPPHQHPSFFTIISLSYFYFAPNLSKVSPKVTSYERQNI